MSTKIYQRGTHRSVPPRETVARVTSYRAKLGITRIANITGLDYLGVPVFIAIRPNSRSLSMASGKGLDEVSATASALMEAAEHAHAERASLPTIVSRYQSLSQEARVLNPSDLPRMRGASFSGIRIEWAQGRCLKQEEPVWLPFELVHLDYTKRKSVGSGIFARGSNGLASGNTLAEAVSAGICELIERDATALWQLKTPTERAARRLKWDTVSDRDCLALHDRLVSNRMSVAVWNATSDVGIACFICRLTEAPENERSALGSFWGVGCHLDRGVALTRAVTEAVQSRLTLISGARDDLHDSDYVPASSRDPIWRLLQRWEEVSAGQDFGNVPSVSAATVEADIEILRQRLSMVGLHQIVVVDLTGRDLGWSVVRVVVPGLEPHDPYNRIKPGARLRRARRG